MKSMITSVVLVWMICGFMLFSAYKILDAMSEQQGRLQDKYAEQYEQLNK